MANMRYRVREDSEKYAVDFYDNGEFMYTIALFGLERDAVLYARIMNERTLSVIEEIYANVN